MSRDDSHCILRSFHVGRNTADAGATGLGRLNSHGRRPISMNPAIEGALMEIRLVADTNLFFECKSLEELPWSDLGYDPVVILLTKPVLDEIDKHKKGSGRTRNRALEIFQRVRGMLESSADEVEI